MAELSSSTERVDVLIGGGGIVGLTLAVALREALGEAFLVAVADPALARPVVEGRATAIVAAARRLLETLGVWEKIASQPILDMVVTDSRLTDVMRPARNGPNSRQRRPEYNDGSIGPEFCARTEDARATIAATRTAYRIKRFMAPTKYGECNKTPTVY